MPITSPEMIVKKGEEFYNINKGDLERDHMGKFVAINVETGECFIGETAEEASHKARQVHPNQISYLTKIGPDRGVFTLRSFRRNSDKWDFRLGVACN